MTDLKLTLENVRSFAGRHEFTIRPLTILVGENSTGKTTLLAALSAVSDLSTFPTHPRLNHAPYHLGSFDTVVTRRNGRISGSAAFSLGVEWTGPRGSEPMGVMAVYRGQQGQVQLAQIELTMDDLRLEVNFPSPADEAKGTATFHTASGSHPLRLLVRDNDFQPEGIGAVFTPLELGIAFGRMSREDALEPWHGDFRRPYGRFLRTAPDRALSIAPIRTRPRRAYDQFSDEFDPEGEHVPYVLLRRLAGVTADGSADVLRNALEQFGREAGLFHVVKAKQFGGTGGPVPTADFRRTDVPQSD